MTAYATERALLAFDAIWREVEGDLRRASMMGRPSLNRGRRMVACLDGDGLAIRLGRDSRPFAEALALPGAQLFTPGRSERTFRDWVHLPVAHADRWPEFLAASVI
jgi:hypothetical protein